VFFLILAFFKTQMLVFFLILTFHRTLYSISMLFVYNSRMESRCDLGLVL
jgi:hypothetical protein